MSTTFAPPLTAAIILYLPVEEKKTGQGSRLFSQKKCEEGI